jgi:hypothetical protein
MLSSINPTGRIIFCNYSAVTDEFISSPFKGEVGRGMG